MLYLTCAHLLIRGDITWASGVLTFRFWRITAGGTVSELHRLAFQIGPVSRTAQTALLNLAPDYHHNPTPVKARANFPRRYAYLRNMLVGVKQIQNLLHAH